MSSRHQAASPDAVERRRPRAGRLVGFLICGFLLALPLLLRPQAWSGGHAAPRPGAVATLRAAAARAARGVAETLRPVQDWAHAQSRVTLFACAALMVCFLAYLMLRE